MKVLLLNGSPRKEGCTFTALNQIAESLNKQGIETEIFQAGNADMENVKEADEKIGNSRWTDCRFTCILGFSHRTDYRVYG